MLALKELLAGRLKFGLIALVIGLVVMLTMLMTAMSTGLIAGMSGAKSALEADALVFQKDTYPTLERSLLSAGDLADIAGTPGVAHVYGVGHSYGTVEIDGEPVDVRIFGLGDRLDELPVVEGRGDPAPGETIADISAKTDGVALGDTLTLSPIGYELTVVGFTEKRQYVMAPGLFVDLPTWEGIHVASVLGRADDAAGASGAEAERMAARFDGGASVAAVDLEPGVTLAELQRTFGDRYTLATPRDAAYEGNGMPEMILSVAGIQYFSIGIGAVLVGVFFYITTLHKTMQIAAIKALGASNGFLYRQLLLQITALVTIAVVIGGALTLGAAASMPPDLGISPEPVSLLLAVAAVYVTAYLGSLFSLRSILKVDPATALGRTDA